MFQISQQRLLLLVFVGFILGWPRLSIAQMEVIDEWLQELETSVQEGQSLALDTILWKKTLEESEGLNYKKGIYDAYRIRATHFMLKDNFLAAIKDLNVATEGYKILQDTTEVLSLSLLEQCYHRLKRPEKSLEINTYALDLSRALGLQQYEADLMISRAYHYLRLGKKEEAHDLFLAAYQLIDRLNMEDRLYRATSSLGYYYLTNNQPNEALAYLQRAYAIAKKDGKIRQQATGLGNLAYCYFLLKNFEQAHIHYDSSLAISIQHQMPAVTYITYKDISETYAAEGKCPEALTFSKKYFLLRDSVIGNDAQRKLDALEIEHERILKEQAMDKLAQEVKIRQQQSIITIGGIALLGLISFLIIHRLIADRRKRKAFIQQQEELHQLKLEAVNTRLQSSKQEIVLKQKDITNLALEMSQKISFASQLQEKTDQFGSKIPNHLQKDWQTYAKFIDAHAQLDQEKKLFHDNIEQINQTFYSNLQKAFPKLTKTDLELCSYFRLNLSNKEIAILRNIAPNTVKVGKYRLRKKLSLDSKEKLGAFLQKF